MDSVQKLSFTRPNFHFLSGQSFDVTIGYETYGELNAARDNAILLCHYWTGTSHAAGRYTSADPAPGWWDALVGPGKPIDTARYFVICSDTLANVQAHDPNVISTGPASIDPVSGQPYGSRYPVVTFRDMVHVQHALLTHLGISKLHAVGGPSGGGMQALEWAVTYPDFATRIFGVCTFPRSSAWFTMAVYRLCRALITADPDWHGGDYYHTPGPQTGFRQALALITLLAQTPARINATALASPAGWELPPDPPTLSDPDGLFAHEHDMAAFITGRAATADANAFLAIARAATLHDVGWRRGGFARALATVRARTLLIACEQDLFFPPMDSAAAIEAIRAGGGAAELYPFSSDFGHFGCLFDTGKFADRLGDFIAAGE